MGRGKSEGDWLPKGIRRFSMLVSIHLLVKFLFLQTGCQKTEITMSTEL